MAAPSLLILTQASPLPAFATLPQCAHAMAERWPQKLPQPIANAVVTNLKNTIKDVLMERFLNKIHYCLFLIQAKGHLLFNYINPGNLLFKIPYIKKRMKDKEGIEDPIKFIDSLYIDEKEGLLGLVSAGGGLIGVLGIAMVSFAILIVKLVTNHSTLDKMYFFILGFVSFIVCYFTVFKNDKYLKYFQEFKSWSKNEKRYNIILTIFLIIAVIVLFFWSLIY
jgi:hypothetical protein